MLFSKLFLKICFGFFYYGFASDCRAYFLSDFLSLDTTTTSLTALFTQLLSLSLFYFVSKIFSDSWYYLYCDPVAVCLNLHATWKHFTLLAVAFRFLLRRKRTVWTVNIGFSQAPRCFTGSVVAVAGGHLHQGWKWTYLLYLPYFSPLGRDFGAQGAFSFSRVGDWDISHLFLLHCLSWSKWSNQDCPKALSWVLSSPCLPQHHAQQMNELANSTAYGNWPALLQRKWSSHAITSSPPLFCLL